PRSSNPGEDGDIAVIVVLSDVRPARRAGLMESKGVLTIRSRVPGAEVAEGKRERLRASSDCPQQNGVVSLTLRNAPRKMAASFNETSSLVSPTWLVSSRDLPGSPRFD